VQVLRVGEWYQLVLHPVHEERRALNFFDLLDVLEAILDQVLQVATGLVLSHGPDAFEARHEQQAPRVSLARDMSSWPTADRSPEENDVLLFDANDFVEVVVEVEGIVEDVVFVRFEHVFSSWLMDGILGRLPSEEGLLRDLIITFFI